MVDSSGSRHEYAVFETDWGWMGIARSQQGLTRVVLPTSDSQDVLSALGNNVISGKDGAAAFKNEIVKFRRYLSGQAVLFTEDLDLSRATPFQRLIWLKTKEIPYGESRSYGWLAYEVKNPRACRAAGQALGHNPLPIVIPCHRVQTADGSIGGFSGGLDIKRRLLWLEGAAAGL